MSSKIVQLVGEKLLSKGNVVVNSSEVLKDKLVALYFSAHWCPPCRQFTPVFSSVYQSMGNKPLAVIFISADQDQEAFNEYFGEQPWYAIPYENSDIREGLNERFGIRGIPSLLVLDQEGNIVSKEGRTEVMKTKEKVYDLWEQKAHSNNRVTA